MLGVTPAGTSNELDVQNEWEEIHTHTTYSPKQSELIFVAIEYVLFCLLVNMEQKNDDGCVVLCTKKEVFLSFSVLLVVEQPEQGKRTETKIVEAHRASLARHSPSACMPTPYRLRIG